jgi:hypothetical protein
MTTTLTEPDTAASRGASAGETAIEGEARR